MYEFTNETFFPVIPAGLCTNGSIWVFSFSGDPISKEETEVVQGY